MKVSFNVVSAARIGAGKIPLYLSSIRIWEALFATPFAFIAMILAADGWPGWHATLWIIVALMGVRTVGMSANRLIHAKEDAINPRTSTRHIPQGILGHKEVLGMILVSGAIFVFASYQLNSLAFWLTPVAIGYVILYSYAKYFTWCCNFMLGWALAMAPAGAWIGVAGTLPMEAVLLSFAVAMWAGGFDIIYGCTDYEFDRSHGINSVPNKFGVLGALKIVRVMHIISVSALLTLGIWMELGYFFYIGWGITVCLLIYENRLVKADDLSKVSVAFFRVNSYVSVQLLFFIVLSVVFK